MEELIEALKEHGHGNGWLWFLGILNAIWSAAAYGALQVQVSGLATKVAALEAWRQAQDGLGIGDRF